MSNNKPTYTEVLEMIRKDNAEIKQTVKEVAGKLDDMDTRLTVLETKHATNTSWVLWGWGFAVVVVNAILNYFFS